jgi:putative transposase
MLKAHKVALDPTNKQATLLAKSAGTARFAYNWALNRWQEQYEAHKTAPESTLQPSQLSLRRELNQVKRTVFPWMGEVTKCAPQEAIINLGAAFTAFFRGRAKYPRFKKRGIHDSFKVSAGTFTVAGDRVRLPRIGWVRMHETFRWPDAAPVSVTISRAAGRWYAAIAADVESTKPPAPAIVLGVDVGVNEYVTSDGTRYRAPHSYRASERQLRRAQQTLSRKMKGSNNRIKARMNVARVHARTASIRRDWVHKTTSDIVGKATVIGIEDLNVKGMTRNRHLAKSVLDASFGEFRRQLEYKTRERASTLIVADRFFPSSKTCSTCGAKTKHLPLSTREWACTTCHTQHDRDLNAAINLAIYAASSAVPACGELSATAPPPQVRTQAVSTKQELDTKPTQASLSRL